MMRTLRNWLTPPVFENEVKTEQAYLLHTIVWALICVPAPFLIYTVLFVPALEDDLKHRKHSIDELESRNAELERFTYSVSHDLKSPLVTITGFLGYLEKDALSGNTDRLHGNIRRIAGAAEKMQALLNDLLELSRIRHLINPPEAVPFNDIVHEAVDRVRGPLDEINATIEIGSIPHPQNGMVFFVRDNGIGIASKYHDTIFGLFNKLDPTIEGTGIGLTLVKRIIEVHGGQIWVESALNKGTTFHFTIPTNPAKE